MPFNGGRYRPVPPHRVNTTDGWVVPEEQEAGCGVKDVDEEKVGGGTGWGWCWALPDVVYSLMHEQRCVLSERVKRVSAERVKPAAIYMRWNVLGGFFDSRGNRSG